MSKQQKLQKPSFLLLALFLHYQLVIALISVSLYIAMFLNRKPIVEIINLNLTYRIVYVNPVLMPYPKHISVYRIYKESAILEDLYRRESR